MKQNYILTIVAISAFALIVLTAFQVNWILEGKRLREEQFDHRVSLALCYAVGQLEENPLSCMPGSASCMPSSVSCMPAESPKGLKFGTFLSNMPEEAVLLEMLENAIRRYGLPSEFEYRLIQRAPMPSLGRWTQPSMPTYSCEVGTASNIQLELFFPEKSQIILGQIGFMLGSSVVLILFISLCFILTILTAWRHKRLAAHNVAFFNHLAHEFRTPLSNIKLASSMLSKSEKQEKSAQEQRFLSVIKEENHRLIEQVDRVLDFARMERGEQPLTFEQVDLHKILQEASDSIGLALQDKEGELKTDIPASLPPIQADAFHLKQVFINLLENAIKYSDEKPRIRLTAIEQGRHVVVSVKDKGRGMSAEEMKHVFKKYFRVEGNVVHEKRGFGLGLPYARMVVEAHGGYIRLSSKEGVGSLFSLFFPKTTPQKT